MNGSELVQHVDQNFTNLRAFLITELRNMANDIAGDIEKLGDAVKLHLERSQDVLNDLARYLNTTHPAVGQDSRIAELINLLQAGTSALADAHAKLAPATVAETAEPGQAPSAGEAPPDTPDDALPAQQAPSP